MKVHHIAITVKNLDSTIKFYQEFFKFKVAKKFERRDLGGKAVFMKLGNFQIELWAFSKTRSDKNLNELNIIGIRHLSFETKNLDKTFKEFSARGLEITKPKMGASGHMYCFTADPNGIALELYQK